MQPKPFPQSPSPIVDVIIPAFNEAASIGKVIGDIPAGIIREIVVVNNSSTDATRTNAAAAGATVIDEPRRGYGQACLRGIAHLVQKQRPPEIVVFLDADYSDHPDEMPRVLAPIINENAQLVIGSRALGHREKGAMQPQQIFGNWLATTLLKWLYGAAFTDLGPFRAITLPALQGLHMQDTTFGWTVEMQLKAAKQNLHYTEVPVSYRQRIGVSKISGTVKGTLKAGYKILYTIFNYR